MLVVLVIAGTAVVGCVVMISLGHGGEMADFPPDVPPLTLPEVDQLTSTTLMAVELPISVVGYQTRMVDETLRRVSAALDQRDLRIAELELWVADLLAQHQRDRSEAHAETCMGDAARADAEETW